MSTSAETIASPSRKLALKRMVEDTSTPEGRRFALFIQGMIVLSTIGFTLETLPQMDSRGTVFLRIIELVTVFVFTIEYVLRIYVADNRWRFVFSFYGLIDLLAILPFYLASTLDLRSMRIVRLLRAFRLLKVARYSHAVERFRAAFQQIREELVVFAAITTLVVYLAAVGIYYFERDAQPQHFSSVVHALWWSICTLTTVGYGDVYPITLGGRLFTGVVLLVGIAVVAIPSGLLAAALTSTRPDQNRPRPDETDSP